jgi:hypothetical protein
MPASPQRRTRRVAPAAAEELDELVQEVPAPLRSKSAAQLRRVQAATAEEKVRLPADERAVEIAEGVLTAPISGKLFRLQESVGLMPLMEWAAATEEVDTGNQAQLAGLFFLLKDVVDPEDWSEFRKYTREEKCNDEDFVKFVNAAIEAIAARPTGEPATS